MILCTYPKGCSVSIYVTYFCKRHLSWLELDWARRLESAGSLKPAKDRESKPRLSGTNNFFSGFGVHVASQIFLCFGLQIKTVFFRGLNELDYGWCPRKRVLLGCWTVLWTVDGSDDCWRKDIKRCRWGGERCRRGIGICKKLGGTR